MPTNSNAATPKFNLQKTAQLLQDKWKQLAGFVVIALLVTTITLFIVPKYYRSFAILVPANPALADKARLFNTNIEGLYSYFGTGDDLDRLFGIASMDTVYKQLVDSFQLVDYYKLTNADQGINRRKAVLELREDLTFQKTDLGQLKVFAWTKEKDLSAKIVNRLVEIVQQTEAAIWKENYRNSLAKLKSNIAGMEAEYKSLASTTGLSDAENKLNQSKLQNILEQMNSYQKAANEFQLAIDNNAPALYVLEKAVPAAKSEKPNKWEILLAALIASSLFGLMGLLVYHREEAF
jgi:hypothetical protein